MQGLVEWSYELLHGDEKTLLHQIAVHRGGASLGVAGRCQRRHGLDETTVTYLLGALVDKSIVSVSFPEEEARYDLLDTVRDYVVERLADERPPWRCPQGPRGVLREAGREGASGATRLGLAGAG